MGWNNIANEAPLFNLAFLSLRQQKFEVDFKFLMNGIKNDNVSGC